jgi:hypothetical protein
MAVSWETIGLVGGGEERQKLPVSFYRSLSFPALFLCSTRGFPVPLLSYHFVYVLDMVGCALFRNIVVVVVVVVKQ